MQLSDDRWDFETTSNDFRQILQQALRQRSLKGAAYDYIKGPAFVFEVDGLCICHAGDLGEPFNEDQLDLIWSCLGSKFLFAPDVHSDKTDLIE
jgi:hypothetical protein